METEIRSDGLRLCAHLVFPPASSGGPGGVRHGLVLCHGFPSGPRGAATAAQTYPELAERLAADAGWAVLAFNLRGTGESEGDFSLGGWLADLRAAIGHLCDAGVDGVWLAGFAVGGSLAICTAAEDERVRGVATFGAPADFAQWAADPVALVDHARRIGVIRSAKFPEDPEQWSRELRELKPVALVGKIPPRSLLIVHGADDDTVPLVDARVLADAAEADVELRVLTGAGHRLRHDPRAIALLLGWLDRQVL